MEITARATQPVSCGVFLNPMGGWDPRFSEGMDLTTEFQTFRFSNRNAKMTERAYIIGIKKLDSDDPGNLLRNKMRGKLPFFQLLL